MQQALTVALAATEAVRQEKGSEMFFTKTQDENSEQAHDLRTRARQNRSLRNASANPQKRVDVKCYECEGRGHLARECPTRLRRKKILEPNAMAKKPE